ncbi:peptidase [Kitasatospora sp. NPDC002040]|uniref:peptidase n=1 Tax=Kitasatospora sp. NPDC002040 TaxID=3154661 RepID=UPI00331AC31F
MRTTALRAALLAAGVPLLMAASPSPSPSPSVSGAAVPVNDAGTSFLTATALGTGQGADVAASTGDYLYWAFGAAEGQTTTVDVTVTLPPSAQRHGPQSWSVELFDGLRRRQSCTAGPQDATAETAAATVALRCSLRQIRSWAEPWSGDPLPGTYYVRLTAGQVPQNDLGLAAGVQLRLTSKGGAGDAQPEGGELRAPLVPPVNAGSPAAAAPTAAAGSTDRAVAPAEEETHWYSAPFQGRNTRWFWTVGGGTLAALAGVLGYRLTRHPRGGAPRRGPANPGTGQPGSFG